MTLIDQFVMDLGITANVAAGILNGQVSQRILAKPARGTGNGQVQFLVVLPVTGVFGAPVTLDLTSIADVAGATVSFSKLTHWAFINNSTTAGQDFNLWGGTNAIFAADPTPVPANGGWIVRAVPDLGITIDSSHKIAKFDVAAGSAVSGLAIFAGR